MIGLVNILNYWVLLLPLDEIIFNFFVSCSPALHNFEEGPPFTLQRLCEVLYFLFLGFMFLLIFLCCLHLSSLPKCSLALVMASKLMCTCNGFFNARPRIMMTWFQFGSTIMMKVDYSVAFVPFDLFWPLFEHMKICASPKPM